MWKLNILNFEQHMLKYLLLLMTFQDHNRGMMKVVGLYGLIEMPKSSTKFYFYFFKKQSKAKQSLLLQ